MGSGGCVVQHVPFVVLVVHPAGFSQGGALSLYVGLRAVAPFAGVLCMSGACALMSLASKRVVCNVFSLESKQFAFA